MTTILLLIIIYLSFISLGLPDSLLGVAWPSMQIEWQMPLDAAGLVALLAIGSTILSSFLSGYIIKRLGTGKVTLFSCILTSGALLGFSYSPSYIWLLLFAIPLGLGAGSVDTALNNYVSLHFKAHHMNWLHSFWGVGATLGPLIMSHTLSSSSSWRLGYRTIGIIQLILAIILLFSLPLWIRHKSITDNNKEDKTIESDKEQNWKSIFRIKGVKYALLTFLFYCATEVSVGLWGSSFLVQIKNLSSEMAASWVAMYFGGITLGRFISGFVSFKLNNTQMIRIGISISLAGSVLLLFPLPNILLMCSFVLIGLGLAPIFPAMIHETPSRFGKKQSQVIIGYQMGFGYIGSALLPPLLGIVVENTSMVIFPFFLVGCIIIMLLCSERLIIISKV